MWNDLTMSERASVIKMAVKAGLRDMKSIRDFYDNSLKYADGGSINISPSKRGTFTAAATKHGMGVQEFASRVLANKDNYSPTMVKKANFAKNASKWKHNLGGYLFEEGGPKATYGKPYYSYDKNMQIETDNGKPILNYSATLPEVNIIPDSKKSPADRNADERFRQKTFSDYTENKDRGYTQRQIAKSQNEWNNSTEKKVLQYGQGIASGIGIVSDMLSGYPVYSTLKGERVLSEAKTPMDYAEAGLWLLPGGFKLFKTLNNARKGIPNIPGLSGLSKEELELERLRAMRRIKGYPEDVNLSGIDDFADNVTTGLSQEAKEGLRRSTIDRNVRAIRQDYTTGQRINNPSNDHILEDLESIERRYRGLTEDAMEGVKVGRYPAEDYLLAGENGTQGFYNGARHFISLNKGAKDILKTEKHEGRHLIDNATLRILTPRQERILQSAYDSDFTQLPYVNRYDFLEGYKNMGTERVTTNRDARDLLLEQLKKDYKLESIPDLATEDKLISTAKDWAIFDAVENSNGYGWAYIDWLKHIGELTPAKAQQFRQAIKHVGGVAAPVAIGTALGNQYAGGGPKNTNREYKSANSWSPSNLHKIFEPISASIMTKGRAQDFSETLVENKSGGTAQDTYLLPSRMQRQVFLERGYTESPNDYGLVKKAVGNRKIPVYQRMQDAISRDKVFPIGNISDEYYGKHDSALEHPGHFPTAVYYSPETSRYYQKAWDLNDYGGGTGHSKEYDKFKRFQANFIDLIGSPVVTTTGIQDVGNLSDIMEGNNEKLTNLTLDFLYSKGLFPLQIETGEKPLIDDNGNPYINMAGDPMVETLYEWVPSLPEVTITGKRRKKVK